jgi:hypothetical protein
MTCQSVNPADGKLLKKFEDLADKELETKLAAAEHWSASCMSTLPF